MFAKMPKNEITFLILSLHQVLADWGADHVSGFPPVRDVGSAPPARSGLPQGLPQPGGLYREVLSSVVLVSSAYRSIGATVVPQHHIICIIRGRGWKLPIVRISIGIGCWVLVFIRIRIISGKFFKGHNTFESLPLPPANVLVPFIESSVGDPWHFGRDPDPAVFVNTYLLKLHLHHFSKIKSRK